MGYKKKVAALFEKMEGVEAEIAELVAQQLGYGPYSELPEQRRQEVDDTVVEMTENWDMATHDDWTLTPAEGVQVLLAKCQEIADQIQDLREAHLPKDVLNLYAEDDPEDD